MSDKIVIGTRGSVLALWQAEHVKARLEAHFPDLTIELKIVKTQGDKILDVPLAKIGGKGLFTKELEEMMLKGEIDMAVHSLKDVPVDIVEGLELSAITKREDPRDCFLSERFADLLSLPQGAKVGTTSLRRSMQIKKIRPDLDTESLRGNVQTRLKRLKEGDFDAIILAMAGVNRLELMGAVAHIVPIPTEVMIPAMGQAALGIETPKGSKASEYAHVLHDMPAMFECGCEREFVRILEGGCQVPIGAHACLHEGILDLRVVIGMPDGSEMLYGQQQGTSPKDLARSLADELIAKGAKAILAKAQAL